MRLLFPTLILFFYILVSLILFLPCRPMVKTVAVLILLIVCLKFSIYETLGGSFIAPRFSPWVLLTMEVLYSAVVILAFLLVVKDFLALLLWLSRYFGSEWYLPFGSGSRGIGLVCTAFALSLFGTWQAIRVPEVHTIEVSLPKMPAELNGFSIIQLSDLHVGIFLKRKWLQEVVKRANAMEADLVVLTGDMIDGTPDALMNDIAPLRNLKARHGVYGITGNHEYYFGVQRWLQTFRELGIDMLQNDFRTFQIRGKSVVLAGASDQADGHYGENGPGLDLPQDPTPLGIRMLLQHRPTGTSDNLAMDLQLSGHTHGGNLFFIKWLIASFNGGLVGGLFDLGGKKLYVSPGTGIWAGFSCRLGIPSEITRIILKSPATAESTIPLN
jgi:uncharacterized protein